jgi:hypothetical protein
MLSRDGVALTALPELFDYHIRGGQNGRGKLETERLCRFHIDDKLKTAGLLNR